MNQYFCKGCNHLMERDSNEKTLKSFCETAGKNVTLIKVEVEFGKKVKVEKPIVSGIPALSKLIDNGWSVEISNEIRRMSLRGERDFYVRTCWKAQRESQRGEHVIKRESRWEGFDTAKEAIADLLKKLKPNEKSKK